MKNTKKQTLAVIALISMLIVSSGLTVLSVNAAVPDRDCRAFISVAPKVIGVGQEAVVDGFIWPSPSGPTFYARDPDPATGVFPEYRNVTVSFTRPDGSKDTFMPTDPTLLVPGATTPCGSIYFYYTPTQAGTWSVTLSFPGQIFYAPNPLGNATVYYKPSTSKPFTFTVTEEKQTGGLLDGSPYSPLPTGYWERPINTDNREWYAIGGNWLANQYDVLGTGYNPYSTAPGSAHIVWKLKNAVASGGIAGGDWGSISYPGGGGAPGTTINGLYYLNAQYGNTFSCYDLRTGEKLYTATGTITQGQNLRIDPARLSGYEIEASRQLFPFLWECTSGATTWKRYDPLTGAVLQTITNVPALDTIRITDGSGDFYVGQRVGWNTTIPLRWAEIYLIKWDYYKVTGNNWKTGVVWNVSLRQPDGRAPSDNVRGLDINPFYMQNVVIVEAFMEDFKAAYDMTTGARLWIKDLGFASIQNLIRSPCSDQYGIFASQDTVANVFVAFDVKTGNKLWTMDPPFDDPWGAAFPSKVVAGDKWYTYSTDGMVRGVELKTGKQIWQTYIGNTTETIYGTWPAFSVESGSVGNLYPMGGADKTVFVSTGISWGVQPYTRFHRLLAYNMDTGALQWSISGIFTIDAISDGYLVGTNSMDGKIYTFGKGKTETTILASPKTLAKGSSALIEGTVMDMSPAQPNTPAVADESMTEWMNYKHMQNATLINTPPTPKGVSVLLYAIDPNGNYAEIGTVTSDSSGLFKKLWTPAIEGTYTIYATFMGSESYWTSSGTTAIGVTEAAATNTGTEQPLTTAADNTGVIVGTGIAVIVAVAVVGLLLLRKKP
jgi:outer membrane protein assembly factor BamB